jgi:hypothetical protein
MNAKVAACMVKRAAAPNPFKAKDAFARAGMAALAGAGLVTGGAIGAGAYESIRSKLAEGNRFRAMLKDNPDLRDKPEKDVKKMFDIVHDISPDLTKSPVVAGAFVRKAMEYKDVGVAPASVKELADINLSIAKARGEKGGYGGLLRNVALASTSHFG